MKWTDNKFELIKQMIISGKTYKEIADIIGCALGTLENQLCKQKIKKSELITSSITKVCKYCNANFTVNKGSDKKHNHKFCSRSCAITYSNKHRIISNNTKKQISKSLGGSGILKRTHCLYCNSKLKTGSKYCSNTCGVKYRREIQIKQWLAGEISGYGNNKKYNLLTAIKQWIFERDQNKCTECGCMKKNPYTGNLVLQIDHIDGDASNCIPSNLRLLCPTCHAMTSTYGYIGAKKSKRTYTRI